jgi:hypothetical protein
MTNKEFFIICCNQSAESNGSFSGTYTQGTSEGVFTCNIQLNYNKNTGNVVVTANAVRTGPWNIFVDVYDLDNGNQYYTATYCQYYGSLADAIASGLPYAGPTSPSGPYYWPVSGTVANITNASGHRIRVGVRVQSQQTSGWLDTSLFDPPYSGSASAPGLLFTMP